MKIRLPKHEMLELRHLHNLSQTLGAVCAAAPGLIPLCAQMMPPIEERMISLRYKGRTQAEEHAAETRARSHKRR